MVDTNDEDIPEKSDFSDDIMMPGQMNFGNKERTLDFTYIVMNSILKCVDAGSKEMVKGRWEQKFDRNGNVMNIYHEDTRLNFISCVDTLRVLVAPHFNTHDKTKKDVGTLIEKISKLRTDLIEKQNEWFNGLDYRSKQSITYVPGYLTQDYIFYQEFINGQVAIYKEILEVIGTYLKDIRYFKQKAYRG